MKRRGLMKKAKLTALVAGCVSQFLVVASAVVTLSSAGWPVCIIYAPNPAGPVDLSQTCHGIYCQTFASGGCNGQLINAIHPCYTYQDSVGYNACTQYVNDSSCMMELSKPSPLIQTADFNYSVPC